MNLTRIPIRSLRLPVLAIAAAGLLQLLQPIPLLQPIETWRSLAAELLLVYAALRIVGWLTLELPGEVGLWKGPSKILRDLGMLLIAAAITVVLVEQRGHVSLVGLITTSAVLTAVVGLAAQETLKDLFAGITLQLDPPFREGDWIDLGDACGSVTQLTLMNTHLIAVDGCQVVLSNSTVAAASLRRFRPGLPVGHRFSIGLDYAFPPSQALELLQQVVSLHPQVMSEPPPTVWVSNYADSSVTYEVLVFQSETGVRAELQLRSELLEQIWYALEREGQSIPFPVRELRRHRDNQPQSAAARFDTIALLSANPLLRHLRDDQRQQLAERTHYQRFARGEVIVREGDPGDALFQVVRGSVEVLKQNQDQELLKVAELRNGDVFGEMTLCADEPRNATVRAQQESWLLKLARQDLLPLIQADPSTLDGIASLVARRRSELDSHANLNAEANENLLKKMHQLFQNLLNSA